MPKKAKLDTSRAYASISSMDPKSPAFEQDGILFDSVGVECGKVKGYVDPKKAAAEKAEVKAKAEKKKAEAQAAEAILGDLGDPGADAKRENAAADAAEEKAAED